MASIGSFGDDRGYGASHAHGGARPVTSQIGQIVNWAGAFVSLGLVVGMAVWAVQLAARDVSGVPVIRALEGPMRSAPEDPGGTQADHQGLAVNRLAEGAAAADVPDTLVLAPPPVELTPVAMSSSSLATEAPKPTPEAAATQTQILIERIMTRDLDAAPVGEGAALEAEDAVIGSLPAPVLPQISPAPPRAISADIPGVNLSIRPPVRPRTILAGASVADAAQALGGTVRDLESASLAQGTRLVQLGAFDSPEIAKAEWDRLLARFPDYFEGRARVIQAANSGGETFFRLRAHGFEDLAASRRFCAALVARNAPCIPVTVR